MKNSKTNQPSSSIEDVPSRKFSKARPLAARVGVSSRTLFRWANSGLISRHKVNGRVVLFSEAEVFALVDASRISATPGAA